MVRNVASGLLLTTALAAVLTGCGANSMAPNRVLLSMAISPAVAAPAAGQVQFSATGTFSLPPSPDTVPFVSPYSGTWTISNPKIATISQTGLATCVPGAAGTVIVSAIASANSAGPGQMSIAVSAAAKLTCP
jgi:hypothetical protein